MTYMQNNELILFVSGNTVVSYTATNFSIIELNVSKPLKRGIMANKI